MPKPQTKAPMPGAGAKDMKKAKFMGANDHLILELKK